MNKEEYYKRLEKTTEKIKTDRCSEDEIANINRQKLYLAEHYISNLEQENQELKKQLEEWEHHLKCSKEMLDIQGQKGNYDYDEYMLGLYNGMEYIIALFETREPNYISGKDVKFTNNKTQQKEFIKYLENEIKIYSNTYMGEMLKEIKEILQKYRSIIGDDK